MRDSSMQMNALQLKKASKGASPELSLTKVPKPAVEKGFLLVKISAAAIWPSDRLNARGGFPNTTFPRIPGRDFSGVVVEGPSHRIGEEVFGTGGESLGFQIDGSHAEFCLIPEDIAVQKPPTLSFIQAAVVGVPYSTALMCLRRARAAENDTVLIMGATGAVGSAATDIAKAMGCKHVLTASRSDSSDVNLVSDPNLTTLQRLTDGKGVDVVVDTVGNLALMEGAIKGLAYGGRYTFIAAPRGQGESTVLNLDIQAAYRNGVELIGCNSVKQMPKQVGIDLAALQKWFEDGALPPRQESDFVTYTLQNASQGYDQLMQKRAVITVEN